jgi:acetyltransferase
VDPDARFALAPIDHDDATLLWRSLRKALLLNGIRGASPVDLAGLADLAVAIGDLMLAHPELTEIDLNPVLAGPNGYVAVDWRMT